MGRQRDLFDTPLAERPHPATFPRSVLAALDDLLPSRGAIIDPMAGTGGVHDLATANRFTVGVELEPEWAMTDQRTIVGCATALPFPADLFDAAATSPPYGNRLADATLGWTGSSRRLSYDRDLGRPLTSGSAAALHWGRGYESAMIPIWRDLCRVVSPGGRVLVNIKDHPRDGATAPVTDWTVATLRGFGLSLYEVRTLPATGMSRSLNAGDPMGENVLAFIVPLP